MASRVAQRQNAKRGRSKSHVPVLFLALLLVVTSGALAVAALFQTSLSGREWPMAEGLDPRATPLSESFLARFGEENPADQLSYQVSPIIELVSADADAPLMIGSPIQNRALLKAEIILEETGEALFSSGFLLPGSEIKDAAFSRAVKPGEHAATVWFYAADPIDQTLLGRVSEPVTIRVLS